MTNRYHNTLVLLSGISALIIGVGVGRFAFTSLLPQMLADGLSVTQAGWLASINYVGYLSGAILAIFIQDKQLKVKLFRFGLLLCVITTVLLGATRSPLWWSVSRLLSGFGAAMALIVGASLVMLSLRFENKTKAMGLHFSGIGIAIVMPDLLIKAGLALELNWQALWLVLSGVALALTPLPWRILRVTTVEPLQHRPLHFDRSLFTPFVLLLIAAYFTEGVGFVVQATFLPDIVDRLIPGFGSQVWLLVGVSAAFSSILLMWVAHHIGSIPTIIIALVLQAVGIVIPTLTDSPALNMLSGLLYGGTFAGLVALFMHLGGEQARGNPVVLMGAITSAYGIGQISAPLYSVRLVEYFGNYNAALWLTAGIVMLGVLLMVASRAVAPRLTKP